MKAYRARYTPEAAGHIRKLHPEIKRDILEGIRVLLSSPLTGHALQFDFLVTDLIASAPTGLCIR